MSESSDTLTDGVRWGSRLAVLGITIAVLSLAVSVVGIGSTDLLYWAGILLSIIAVTGAAIRGAQSSGFRHAGGVISAMVGVFVIGYGVENGTLLLTLVGVVILVVGTLGVILDTQRTE
jgi:hypothetical protein